MGNDAVRPHRAADYLIFKPPEFTSPSRNEARVHAMISAELRKIGDGKADANVVLWVGAEDATRFFLSAITILELERGALGMRRRTERSAAFLARRSCGGRNSPTVSADDAVATRCAHLHIPNRGNEADALIAATALVHDVIAVTRNIRDFEGTDVVVVDPWQV